MPSATARVARSRWFRLSIILLKLALVPLGMAVLVKFLVTDESFSRLTAPNGFILAAITVNAFALLLIALRMRGTLDCFGIKIGVRNAFRIHLQSLFYFFFVPGSVGMELSRFTKVRALQPAVPNKALGFAVLFDRILGVAAACILSLMLLPWIELPPIHLDLGLLTMLLAAAVVVAAVAAFIARREFFTRVRASLAAITERRSKFAALLALSIAGQAAQAYAVYLGGISVGIDVPAAIILFGVSAATLSMVLPLTLAGAGPSEAAGLVIFVVLGASPSDALVLVFLAYAGRLCGALAGGLWEIVEAGGVLRA